MDEVIHYLIDLVILGWCAYLSYEVSQLWKAHAASLAMMREMVAAFGKATHEAMRDRSREDGNLK